MAKPLIIGLTGGIASGKSTVASYLANLGAQLIDADCIARQVVTPDSPTNHCIRQLFGDDYFLRDGNLDRSKIKQLIFNDTNAKLQYESIIHPAINIAITDSLRNVSRDICYGLLVLPLLFEKGFDQYTDYNISVDLPAEEQIRRAVQRKPDDKDVIHQIIASQMPRQQRNKLADFVINNNQPLPKLHNELDTLHIKLCALKKCI